MNTVIQTMIDRRSIRAYTDEKLTADEIATLKIAALSAPTAMNRQTQKFAFVTDAKLIDKVEKRVYESIVKAGENELAERIKSRNGKILYDTQLLVVVTAKHGHFAPVDAGIAVENIALAAKSMGLDSVILGMPARAFEGEGSQELYSDLRIPDDYKFMIAIAVGHPAMDKDPHEFDMTNCIDI